MCFTDAGESGKGAGVAAVEDAILRSGDRPGRPERVIPVTQSAPGEMARWSRGEGEGADSCGFGPVQLDDAIRSDTPPLEVAPTPSGTTKRARAWMALRANARTTPRSR